MVLKPAFTQPLQDWPLSRLCLVKQGTIHKAPFLGFRLQGRSRAQVSLVSQHNEKFRLLTVGSAFHHPRRDLPCLKRAGAAAGRGYCRLP